MVSAKFLLIFRKLYIAAREGKAVYAQNPSYTDLDGREILESVKDEAMLVDPGVGKLFYHDRIYRRRSSDNGLTWVEEPDLTTDARDLKVSPPSA